MFGFGPLELVLMSLILLLVVGATRVPKLARGIGEAIRNFRRELRGTDVDVDQRALERRKENVSSEH